MLLSMTGFARESQLTDLGMLSIEIRSVNHRYLDPSFRMPELLRNFEPVLREVLAEKISRGKVDISIRLDMDQNPASTLIFNRDLATRIVEIHQETQGLLGDERVLTATELMRFPNVVTTAAPDPEAIKPVLMTLFNNALDALLENRKREGTRILEMLTERLNKMADLVIDAKAQRPTAIEKIKERLLSRLEEIDIEHDPNRFEQELVYVTQRLDVDEEIDRLNAHIEEMRNVFTRNEPVGRRLDFLSQELNREANTLGSKSQDVKLTQIGVDLKVLIEQIREQIQNIE
ncbi:YicC family protein [Ignatzschineria sp. RMDPL8A]|uniref:YicC/YloC family endoribonuclease n=1 Tax=Ignatzschineria sp. RMDPL8A TaxID=2999236 RepID=UPI00244674A8|nr:YicC/YloC family endoribonuclease [Ignatzschineria sp. RMDPL8A]MDG9729835.1 YicC family protein [Ignatzschineria sp. RMDPL8A]